MAKKILKGAKKLAGGVVGGILGIGNKKKAPTPVEGQPVVTPLNQTAPKRDPRRRQRATLGGTVLDDRSGTLGG